SLNYNVTATGGHFDNVNESRSETTAVDTNTGAPVLSQVQHDRAASQGENLNINGRFNWKLDGGDNFTLVPFLISNPSRSALSTPLDQPFGLTPPPYNTAETGGHSDITAARMFGNWRLRLPEGARLELRFNTGTARSDVESDTQQFNAAGFPAHTIHVATNIR